MHTVRVKIERSNWTVEAIAANIARTIYPGCDDSRHPIAYLKNENDPNHWVLGTANDWFMTYFPETKEVELSYRYSGGHNVAATEAMDALAKWLAWRMK